MSSSNLPQAKPHNPTTFAERGVTVPFTTPMLLGARIRLTDRDGTEVVVANPSGGLGVYILPWSGVSQFCRPTVHDIRLHGAIAARAPITPAMVREVARAVAADGLAGQPARAAATAAVATESRDRLVTNFRLMVALADVAEPGGSMAPAELERRAKVCIERLAPRLGRDSAGLFAELEHLAGVLAPVGMGGQTPVPLLQRVLAMVVRLRDDAAAWARAHTDDSGAPARLVAAVADTTVACANASLREVEAANSDVPTLLRGWVVQPDSIARLLARLDWLLDGWEQLCLIWSCAQTQAARRAAMTEIALLAPILPNEAAAWLGGPVDTGAAWQMRRQLSVTGVSRTCDGAAQTARNERLRALAA
jgi:hypothetical protein